MLERLRLAWARRRSRLAVQLESLEQPLPATRAPLAALEMIALDFETTGLDWSRDHLIAAGWLLIRADRIILSSAREVRVSLDSESGVGQSATIHGLVDSDLDHAEDASALLAQLLPELAGRVIVAHAAAIERGFLDALLTSMGGARMPHRFVDTMAQERQLMELEGQRIGEGDLTLDACRKRRGLPAHSSHSALADALACAELLLAQIEQMGGATRVRLRDLSCA